MKKINTSKLSGTQELTPAEQSIFNNLKATVSEVFHLHGYQEIETPTIERTEILLAKAGGETEKQIYKIIKTSEPEANADQALCFDHTVPLARYVVEHENDLNFPFKVSQIGKNFRGERAQKGRFREFYQCDIDVVGRDSLPIAYDADIISTLLHVFDNFELNTSILARINNRKIFTGLLQELNLEEQSKEIYSIVDHAEKVTPEQTKVALEELGLEKDNVKKITAFIALHGERSFVITELNNLEIKNELFATGVTELDQVMYLLESAGHQDQVEADMKIVRGLDYYTGTVFEFILPEYKNAGSVCGGGRYENLSTYFSDKKFPGVGGAIGLTRLYHILSEANLLKQPQKLTDYAIIPVSEKEYDEAINVTNKLNRKNRSATIIFTNKKLSDKLTYASKIATNGIVIGEDEIASGILQIKNFDSGEISELNMKVESSPEDFWAD